MLEFIATTKQVISEVARAKSFAKTNEPCLIVGEKGTGRSHLAKFIHKNSAHEAERFHAFDARRSKDISKELFGEIRSTLLGGESYTEGAIDKAAGGTLLIKNLQCVPIDVQLQLLATVKLGGFKPVGGSESLKSLCRYIFTVPYDSKRMVEEKKLVPELKDIFNRTTFKLPLLKDRSDDIEPISEYFLKKWCDNLNLPERRFTKQAIKLLKRSKWQGNVAELQVVILNAVLAFDTAEIDAKHLELKMGGNWREYTKEQLEETALEEIVEMKLSQFMQKLGRYDVDDLHAAIIERVERPLIKLVMQKAGDNQLKAARMLGINRNTLRSKLKRLEIK